MTKEQRLEKWYTDVRTGLFVHWGINTGNPGWLDGKMLYKDAEEFEAAANDNGWCAEKWVSAAKKLRAGYITLATFHCCIGYIRPWRSNIPGTAVTKRDFLGELIDAAKKEGIRVIVYITSDPSWQERFEGYRPLDPDAYRAYKNNPDVDILRFDDWQRHFCKENVAELLENYPDLAGFWFDGWNNIEVCDEVFGYIHQLREDALIIKNDFGYTPTADEDVMSIECFGKRNSPDYDYTSGAWVEQRCAECCYVLIGDWWYYQEIGEVDYRFLMKQFTSIITNGWVAKVGFGPKVGGDFPDEINRLIDYIDEYFNWAEEAVLNTVPGGLAGGNWNGGGYGFTTHNPGAGLYYAHVCTAPQSDVLIIPAPGLAVSRVEDMRTAKEYEFAQRDGALHIKGADFSAIDSDGTVILRVSAERLPELARFEVETTAKEIVFDLNSSVKVTEVVLSQTEDTSLTYGGWASPQSKRIKEFTLYASNDGADYTKVLSGTFANQRGGKALYLPSCEARYLKLCAESDYYGHGGVIEKWENLGWTETAFDDVTSYACDKDGVIWYTTSGGDLYKNCGGMSAFVAENIVAASVGLDGKVYLIDMDNNVEGTALKAKKFTVDSAGTPYYTDMNDSLWVGDRCVSDGVSDFALSPDGMLWMIIGGTLYSGAEMKRFNCAAALTEVVCVRENQLYLNVGGTVYMDNFHGTNLTVIGHDAGRIFGGADGRFVKLKAEYTGNVKINEVKVY